MPHLFGNDFKCFLLKVFATIAPQEEFHDSWHINLLIAYLRAIEEGKILRLVINVPPRSLKSTIISVTWPVWLLAHKPHTKIIVASHSQGLSLKHARQSRLIMSAPWYKQAFPQVQIAKGDDTKSKFITTQQGFRLATSVGSQLTGEGADILLMDDPQTPAQAASPKLRQKTNDWFAQTFASRLNDKKRGAILLVSQRLHAHDLSHYLLSKPGLWQQLKIPAQSDEAHHYKIGSFAYHRQVGELLHPAREGASELARARLELGADAFNAQYQQNPTNSQLAMIKPQWLKRYKSLPADGIFYQSWDCGIKVGEQHDYSVCTTWQVAAGQYFLVDLVQARYEYPHLKQHSIALYQRYACQAVLVEDKASGQALLQELKHCHINAIAIMPKGSKITRLLRTASCFEAGKVYFPEHAIWLAALEEELFGFPNSPHDDQVDSVSQFLLWISNHRRLQPGMQRL